MMKPYSTVLGFFALLFLVLPNLTTACSCIYIPTFCGTITFGADTIDQNMTIIRLQKSGTASNGNMRAKVLSVYFGEVISPEIEIRRGNGADCGVDTDIFDNQSEWIMALWGGQENENTVYFLSICGINYLEVSGGQVKGPIKEGLEQIGVEQFPQIMGCGDFNVVDPPKEPNFYPNPAGDYMNIEWEVNTPIEGFISIYDAAGRLVGKNISQFEDGQSIFTLPTNNLPSGLYVVELAYFNERVRRKLIIQR